MCFYSLTILYIFSQISFKMVNEVLKYLIALEGIIHCLQYHVENFHRIWTCMPHISSFSLLIVNQIYKWNMTYYDTKQTYLKCMTCWPLQALTIDSNHIVIVSMPAMCSHYSVKCVSYNSQKYTMKPVALIHVIWLKSIDWRLQRVIFYIQMLVSSTYWTYCNLMNINSYTLFFYSSSSHFMLQCWNISPTRLCSYPCYHCDFHNAASGYSDKSFRWVSARKT